MSVNKVILVGRLGKKPELKQNKAGKNYAALNLALNNSYTDKSGQKHDKTTWVYVTMYGKTAENCTKYLDKGAEVYVEGEITSYEKEGKTNLGVTSRLVTFLSRGNQEENSGVQEPQDSYPDGYPHE